MKLLEHSGFIPNRSKRVSDFYTLDWRAINGGANPFSKIAGMGGEGCRRAAALDIRILFCKMSGCAKHRVLAQLLNIETHENPWRILEVLHEIVAARVGGKLPDMWRDILKTFGAPFHGGIKNREAGHEKVLRATYCALCWVARPTGKPEPADNDSSAATNGFIIREVAATWPLIIDKLYSFISSYLQQIETTCTCNDYRIFDAPIVQEIIDRYSYQPGIIQTKINSISIDHSLVNYRQAFCDAINHIWWRMPRALRASHKSVRYDMAPEMYRAEYIKSIIFGNKNLPVISECGAAYCIDRAPNTCFVCDRDLCPASYSPYIREGEIAEANGEFITALVAAPRHGILQRCERCLRGKFGGPFRSTAQTILARHFKWMTFYAAARDPGSPLADIPRDVFWLIIHDYSMAR